MHYALPQVSYAKAIDYWFGGRALKIAKIVFSPDVVISNDFLHTNLLIVLLPLIHSGPSILVESVECFLPKRKSLVLFVISYSTVEILNDPPICKSDCKFTW